MLWGFHHTVVTRFTTSHAHACLSHRYAPTPQRRRYDAGGLLSILQSVGMTRTLDLSNIDEVGEPHDPTAGSAASPSRPARTPHSLLKPDHRPTAAASRT